MATTKRNAMLIEEARKKIQTTKLVERLMQCARGEIELRTDQLKSIEILLRKSIPDLASIEATIDGEVRERVINYQPLSEEDWSARYGNGLATTSGASKSTH